jgi:hypothetical protein
MAHEAGFSVAQQLSQPGWFTRAITAGRVADRT